MERILCNFICKSSILKVSLMPLQYYIGCLVGKSCPTLLRPQGLQPSRLLCAWDFPGKNTGVGSHFLLQGTFLSHGLNLRLLHRLADALPLSHQESPSVLHWHHTKKSEAEIVSL